MSERGQLSIAAVGVLMLLVLAGVVLAYLVRVDEAGATAQKAADMAALAAAGVLAEDPAASEQSLREAAERIARSNGGRVVAFAVLRDDGLPSGVEVTAEVVARGSMPAAGAREDSVRAVSRAGVTYSATLDALGFRPIDLHGAIGRAAIVRAALAQVGWPYVWGGESRAEGGFDCSGLVGFAYAAAGHALPGRPTAASLWAMGTAISPAELEPGDLVFRGAPSGAPYHVGLYAGGGAVIVAPHTGARVRVEAVTAGGWDGFGRLAAAGAAGVETLDPVLDAARSAGAPPHVVAAELRLGLRNDAPTAAAELAQAMAVNDDLSAALESQLGSASAAAVVLREASGPALGSGFQAAVRLLPRPSHPATADGSLVPTALRVPVAAADPSGGSRSRSGWVGAALHAGETVAEQLAHRGSQISTQALAGVRNGARFALTGVSLLGPRDWREPAAMAGSAWDAGFGAVEALASRASAGMALRGWALGAARLNVLAAGISAGVFAAAAYRAPSRRERLGNGLLAAGSAMSAAGLLTSGSGLMPLVAAGAVVVPPAGLVLLAAGAAVCVGGYLVLHPEWCRGALHAGARALDLAWRAQTAPVRIAASAADSGWRAAKSGARKVKETVSSVVDSLPTPW
jgi:cell wall-associated NlpC family hydrolase